MIPEPHSILSAAVHMLKRCGSGLLMTHSPTGPPQTWIGTPVHTVDGHLLFSHVDPECDLIPLAATHPRATWRFHDLEGRLVFFFEGTLSVLPSSVMGWRHVGQAARRMESGAVSVVTNVLSIVEVVPSEKMVCRVVLPQPGSAALSSQPALAF